MRYLFSVSIIFILLCSCDHIENPYPPQVSIDLDTNLYPGLWSDYETNEWPLFGTNPNTLRNVIIEDFTGHTCNNCPAVADYVHNLYLANPTRIYNVAIHAGTNGLDSFQEVDLPDYPTDFTNPQGLEIGSYFGTSVSVGFFGNPSVSANRYGTAEGFFSSNPLLIEDRANQMLSNNDLKVNLQAKLNYYEETKGAFLHVEADPYESSIIDDLSIMVYLIEDSLVGDQKMSDNSHNSSYVHRDIHRGNLNNESFGRPITSENLANDKYLVNYSFTVPNQLNGEHNPSNMHLLICAFNQTTWEIYQVIKQKIE
jgi:hypothetical protein